LDNKQFPYITWHCC